MTDELPATIAEAGEWLRARRISSLELTRVLLERAQAAQDSVGAFMTFTEDSAITAAHAADEALARGEDSRPLLGVPLGVKDILATADAPTRANSNVLDPTWGQRGDATSVRKLREAGGVVLGKLVLHEFAIGWPDPATGLHFARNPWALGRRAWQQHAMQSGVAKLLHERPWNAALALGFSLQLAHGLEQARGGVEDRLSILGSGRCGQRAGQRTRDEGPAASAPA